MLTISPPPNPNGKWKKNTNSISKTKNKIRKIQKLMENEVRPKCLESKPHSKADRVSRFPFKPLLLASKDSPAKTSHRQLITKKQTKVKMTKVFADKIKVYVETDVMTTPSRFSYNRRL